MRTRFVNPFLFETPKFLKKFILAIFVFSIAVVGFDSLFSTKISLQEVFTVNHLFFDSYFLWQPITALFIIPLQHFSLGAFFDMAFPLLILWCFGSELIRLLSFRQFSIIFFGSSLVASATSILLMYAFHQNVALSTLYPALLAITTTWTMCVPQEERVLFFFIPVSSRMFLIIALLGTIFLNIVSAEYIRAFSYCTSFLFSYVTGLLLWNLRGPFQSIRRYEQFLRYVYAKTLSFWLWRPKS